MLKMFRRLRVTNIKYIRLCFGRRIIIMTIDHRNQCVYMRTVNANMATQQRILKLLAN